MCEYFQKKIVNIFNLCTRKVHIYMIQSQFALCFLFEAICWTLWPNRNDCIFNNRIISSPRAIIFRLISFMHPYWTITSTEESGMRWSCLLKHLGLSARRTSGDGRGMIFSGKFVPAGR
jgi:hypothetical protein